MKFQLKNITWICLLLFFSACGKKDKASRKPLEGKKVEYLLQQMNANEFHFETFSSKAEFTFEQNGKKNSFKANVRIKKDSIVWISITPLFGIELGRIAITHDTVKVINRLEKEFFIGDESYIKKRFNIDMDFDLLQAMLLGNSMGFEPDEKVKFAIDKEQYYLGNLRMRKVRKADEKPHKIEKESEEFLSLWLDQNSFKIREFLISDITADRFLKGAFSNYEDVEGQLLPKNLHFELQTDKPAVFDIDYSRVYLNKSLNFAFTISSKYEQVYY